MPITGLLPPNPPTEHLCPLPPGLSQKAQIHRISPQNLLSSTSSRKHQKGLCPPLGSPQGKRVEYLFHKPFPAAPPVESLKYRLTRKSKGLHPDRLNRRPGPRLDFPAPAWLSGVIDGRLRRGNGFRARVFCRDGKPSKTFSTAENITLQ